MRKIDFTSIRETFDLFLEKRRSGENVESELKDFSKEIAILIPNTKKLKEYERLANLFYRCQEILLMDYGVGTPVVLPPHPKPLLDDLKLQPAKKSVKEISIIEEPKIIPEKRKEPNVVYGKYAKGYNQPVDKLPGRAWAVILAGTTINLCLGCLYAWSVWLKYLTDDAYMKAQGWAGALTAEQASNPKSLCILIFALLMVPGGKLQDKYGPSVPGTIGALCMAIGMIIAGTAHSYTGILLGFGVGGGVAMGVAYAAPVPATRRWVGPHQVGLMIGITVSGYGGAAFYVAPLIKYLIIAKSLSYSFVVLGIAYLIIIGIAAQVLAWPEEGYAPPPPPEAWTTAMKAKTGITAVDWTAGEMLKTYQFYVLVALFCLNTQAGLLIIGHAAKFVRPLLEQGFILVAAGGYMNAVGRIGTGKYSDILGRSRAYTINAAAAALCMFTLPWMIGIKSLFLTFTACMLAFWVYGGGLSLLPSYTADFFGPKNLGFNYGLVFMGWGLGAFMPKLAGRIRDVTGSYDWAFYVAGILLIVSIVLALVTKRPLKAGA